MFVMLRWGKGYNTIDEVPSSFLNNPMRRAQLVQYIDASLNNNIRKKLGNRFPAFLTTPNETEKKYYLHELEQNVLIELIFLPEIEIMGWCNHSSKGNSVYA